MRVIERNDPIPGWPKQIVCADANGSGRGCGSTLEIVPPDVTLPGQRDGGNNGWVHCPVCQNVIYLTQTDTRSASRAQSILQSQAATCAAPPPAGRS